VEHGDVKPGGACGGRALVALCDAESCARRDRYGPQPGTGCRGCRRSPTGQAFFLLNLATPPLVLNPLIALRIRAISHAPRHFTQPGLHAEVHALNTALLERCAKGYPPPARQDLGEFILDTAWLRGSRAGRMKPLDRAQRCGNCAHITDGVINLAGDVP
jgi:hypothetical protein